MRDVVRERGMIGGSELRIGLVLKTLVWACGIGTLKERRQSNSDNLFWRFAIVAIYGNYCEIWKLKKLEKIGKIRHFGNCRGIRRLSQSEKINLTFWKLSEWKRMGFWESIADKVKWTFLESIADKVKWTFWKNVADVREIHEGLAVEFDFSGRERD